MATEEKSEFLKNVDKAEEAIQKRLAIGTNRSYSEMRKDDKLGAMTSIYIAGPMTGYPEYNYPAFEATAKKYRDLGFRVTSPHEVDKQDGSAPEADGKLKKPWEWYLKRDRKFRKALALTISEPRPNCPRPARRPKAAPTATPPASAPLPSPA